MKRPAPKKKRPEGAAQPDLLIAVVLLLLATTFVVFAVSPVPTGKPTSYPGWWFERDVIRRSDTNVSNPAWPTNYLQSDDYAALNAGQLKSLASRAYEELQARMPTNIWTGSTNAPGPKLTSLITGWSTNTVAGDNYAAVNQGQLKHVAKHFYDVLAEAGYVAGTNVTPLGWTTGAYPWSSSTNSPDAYAVANIGQAKYLFSFDLTNFDSDDSDLPDWWEDLYFGELGQDPGADLDGDGLTNLQEYEENSDPLDYYSQGGIIVIPTLTIVSGSGQTGEPSTFASAPLEVQVNSGTTILAGAPVTFTITGSGGGQVATTTSGSGLTGSLALTTGTDGRAQVYFQYPATYAVSGTVMVTAGSGTNMAQAVFTETSSLFPTSGLALWLKADAGVSKDGSNKVSGWQDQSGLLNSGTQSNPANQPTWVDNSINGKPTVRFSGSSYLIVSDTSSLRPTTTFTILAVAKQNSTSPAFQTLLCRPYRSTGWSAPFISYAVNLFGASSSNYLRMAITTTGSVTQALQPANQYDISKVQLATYIYTGTTQEIYRGGNLVSRSIASGTIEYGTAAAITIGSRSSGSPAEYMNANLAELLIYTGSLSLSQRQQTENYLTAKYALDTDGDGMPDTYEIANGLNPLVDDLMEDKDGDGVPNQWEYAKGTAAGTADDWSGTASPVDWIVDPVHGGDSPSDNIVSTIAEATGTVPVDNGNIAASYQTILIRGEEYTEAVSIPSNKRIALIGRAGADPVRLVGPNVNTAVVTVGGRSSLSGLWITRPQSVKISGTIPPNGVGVELYPANGQQVRIANCLIDAQNAGIISNNNPGTLATVEHCTIFNNFEGGIYSYVGSRFTVKNSILWNPGVSEFGRNSGNPNLAGNIVRTGTFSGIDSDPLLLANGTLRAGSPAINSGTSSTMNTDIHGEARPFGAARDLGADEYVDSDSDDLPDGWEMQQFGDLDETAAGDIDGDGLDNLGEFLALTNPNVADTDGDGAGDSAEIVAGSDPWVADTDGDNMPDGYEIAKGLDPLANDELYDRDGDGVPNRWEQAKGTSAANREDFPVDWVVDPVNSGTSTTDNVMATIDEAIAQVPVYQGEEYVSTQYQVIYVKSGEYAEKVTIPSNKRIALVGERGGRPPRLVGASVSDYVLEVSNRSVVDGFVITRPRSALQEGTVSQSGISSSPVSEWRMGNCIVSGHRGRYGAMRVAGGVPTDVDHCTFYGNETNSTASDASNGISVLSGAKLNLQGTILWNNETLGKPQIYKASNGVITASWNIVRGAQSWGANTDPLLRHDGMLSPTSPAIDGDTGAIWLGGDIDGDDRPYGSAKDIGADEYVDEDEDGLPDGWEMEQFGDLDEAATGDSDEDGLNHLEEYQTNTNPNDADSDDDGANDDTEAANNTNPNLADSDGDLMLDGYEIANGLNPLADDSIYDKDGDGVPNYWEYVNGSAAGDKNGINPDWIVDPAHADDSASDNIVGTILEAVTEVPVEDANNPGASYKSILVKSGEYAEKVSLPENKRIALVGERGFEPVKLLGGPVTENVVEVRKRSVVDGFWVSRPTTAIRDNTVTGAGVYGYGLGQAPRVSNCIITDQSVGITHDNIRWGDWGTRSYSGGVMVIDGCTVYRNKTNGLSAYSQAGTQIRGSIFWNPAAAAEMQTSSTGAYVSVNNIIRGGAWGGVNVDPQLTVDGRLTFSSTVAIDADNAAATIRGDIQGEPRPTGSARDIGADEWVDSDNDNLPDTWEMKWFGDLDEVADGDVDADGLSNQAEYAIATNPVLPDTDGDGAPDVQELAAGTYPLLGDSDADKMTDGYELANGLNPLRDDAYEDKDGDGVPNLWEYVNDSSAGDNSDINPDWIVDPAHANDSPNDNIVGTITAATDAVPADNGDISQSYKTILVKSGTYAERVIIPDNASVALVGEAGVMPVKITGTNVAQNVIDMQGRGVISNFHVTRPDSAIQAGNVAGQGISARATLGPVWLVNCIISWHRDGLGLGDSSPFLVVDHCTVINNKSTGISASNRSQNRIRSTILWNPGVTPANEYAASQGNNNISSSLIRGGFYPGISGDPRLTNEGMLTSSSVAIDADISTLVQGGDIQGEARPAGAARDIGADEWVDSDGDQMPDSWEKRWLGNLDGDAGEDTDADGVTNYYEFEYGSDPADALSQGGVPNSRVIMIKGGNHQAGPPGEYLEEPLLIEVRSGTGGALVANADVSLVVISGSGGLASLYGGTVASGTLTVNTGSNGFAAAYYRQGLGTGATSLITARSGTSEIVTFAMQTSEAAGLWSVWKFNEGGGLRASEVTGFTSSGTLRNYAGWTTGFDGAGALALSGSTSYVSMGSPSAAGLDFGRGSFSVAFWIKYSEIPASPDTFRIVSKGYSAWASGYFVGLRGNGSLATGIGSAAGQPENALLFRTTEEFNDGKWHHVAVVYDRTAASAKIYVDGSAKTLAKEDGTGGEIDPGDPVSILFPALSELEAGHPEVPFTLSGHLGSSDFFRGAIDEVRLYRKALSSGEVQDLFNVDGDANELPDHWEWAQFGRLGVEGGADADGDGLTNLQEYEQGGDPNDYFVQGTDTVEPVVTIVAGDNQAGLANEYLADPLIVEVRDGAAGPFLIDAPVTFVVSSGSGGLAAETEGSETGTTIIVRSGTDGRASVYYRNGSQGGVTDTITAFSGTSVPAAFVANSVSTLWSHWKFDEGTGTTAVEAGGVGGEGTLANGALWGTGFNTQGGLEFSGTNSYVLMNNSIARPLDFDTEVFSVAFWVKFTSIPSVSEVRRIIGKGFSGWGAGYFVGLVGDGRIAAGLGASTEVQADALLFKTMQEYNDGKWHHVAVVFDREAETARIYLDGIAAELEQVGGSGGVIDSADPTVLGFPGLEHLSAAQPGADFTVASANGVSEFFLGELDDLRIYRETLDEREVGALYHTDGDGDGLPDWWEMKWFGSVAYNANDDSDGDGLGNIKELESGTNPDNSDTDGDGISDGTELETGTDPADGEAAAMGLEVYTKME